MAAEKRGFCRSNADNKVKPERGSPEITCSFETTTIPSFPWRSLGKNDGHPADLRQMAITLFYCRQCADSDVVRMLVLAANSDDNTEEAAPGSALKAAMAWIS